MTNVWLDKNEDEELDFSTSHFYNTQGYVYNSGIVGYNITIVNEDGKLSNYSFIDESRYCNYYISDNSWSRIINPNANLDYIKQSKLDSKYKKVEFKQFVTHVVKYYKKTGKPMTVTAIHGFKNIEKYEK